MSVEIHFPHNLERESGRSPGPKTDAKASDIFNCVEREKTVYILGAYESLIRRPGDEKRLDNPTPPA